VAYKAGIFDALLFFVALSTVVHLHPVPGVLLVTCRIRTPDVPTVLGEAIVIVRLGVIRVPHGSVTGSAFHLALNHVGRMGEKDTLRLAGIDKPWNLLSRLNILLDELCLLRMLSYLFFVTFKTTG
jgi:hypothetical protein